MYFPLLCSEVSILSCAYIRNFNSYVTMQFFLIQHNHLPDYSWRAICEKEKDKNLDESRTFNVKNTKAQFVGKSTGITFKALYYSTDVNECHESNSCHQRCFNTIGSFHCGCDPGYQLKGRKCMGMK